MTRLAASSIAPMAVRDASCWVPSGERTKNPINIVADSISASAGVRRLKRRT